MDLPEQIRRSLEAQLHGVSRLDLARRAAALSQTYRAARASDSAIAAPADALAYAVARMPATYAATATAFARTAEQIPEFRPETLLDVDGGPGTASFAALAQWPGVARVRMLERNAAFRDLARALFDGDGRPALAEAQILGRDVARASSDWPKADLVVASYVGVELSDGEARAMVRAAIESSQGVLVLIEPGTPAGFARIRAAREALIGMQALPLAPCPHAEACPMLAPDWCHFSVRLARSRDHKLVKSADAPFEDEKFSYVAAARTARALPGQRRIIAAPRASKAAVTLRVCEAAGLREHVVPRRDRAAWKAAKRLAWGDLMRNNQATANGDP
jgi:ribosomal protein RSM22 (predicted rRNA methylase)